MNNNSKSKSTFLDYRNMLYGTNFKTMQELEEYEKSIEKVREFNTLDGVLGCVKV